MSCLRGVPADDVLDGSSSDVTVVGCSGGKWRTIVECVGRKILGLLQLLLEGLNALPVLERLLLLLREIDPFRGYISRNVLGLNSVLLNIFYDNNGKNC